MKILTLRIIAIATIFASSVTLASTSTDHWNQKHGTYIDVNAGTNLVYLGVISSQGNASYTGLYGFGYSFDVGYSFTSYFAIEAGFMQNYINLNQIFDSDLENSNQRKHSNVPYASMKFILPIGNRTSLFGKLGVMYANAEGESLVLPYTGIGFSYAVTRKIDIDIQYQGAIYGVAGAGLLSAGISYHI